MAFMPSRILVACAVPAFLIWWAGAIRDEAGPHPFSVGQYNILAKYLGDNREPWFLYPLNLSETERYAIQKNFLTKDNGGNYINNFGNGFGGVLSPEQRRQVQAANAPFAWENREQKLLQTAKGLDVDILSLVELDTYEEFRAALSPEYASAFVKRPRSSSHDGCGIFWRKGRFEPVAEPLKVTFDDWTPGKARSRKDRALLVVALRDRLDGRVLVAASTHLMRNPEDKGKDPQRMLQVAQMMSRISCYVAEVGAAGLVVLGDFNALPDSWTHMLMLKGWQDCPDSEKRMVDAADVMTGERAFPQHGFCTSRTKARTMWIDYVFVSSKTIDVVDGPIVESCPAEPIPDSSHPSDHLPVRVMLRFREDAEVLGHCAVKEPSSELELGGWLRDALGMDSSPRVDS
uniref:Endonuclease/exonuclease/phosphatase domain-containing protein n=1 Tax=Pyrodinium bahamense TaxID=73915 RepID=A0A7S0BA46_9DINO|mmetsp:Transcript_54656/g.151632  ORF Transcript_54656/g.151632 Transcript_54656/m.151632 type:complete len:403 (+) Transcript_54656:55-1263(+)